MAKWFDSEIPRYACGWPSGLPKRVHVMLADGQVVCLRDSMLCLRMGKWLDSEIPRYACGWPSGLTQRFHVMLADGHVV